MADNTANPPVTPWLPAEIWGLIASFLDEHELALFRQVCQTFNRIGSDAMMLQPLYNRLRAIDSTLPADLQTAAAAQAGKSPLMFFKEAFEKIQAGQRQEIAYLTKHHPVIMTKPEYAQVLQHNTSTSLKSLEAKNAVLDAVNSGIVTTRINISSTQLNLSNAGITRLPVAFFQAPGYANFWKNLTHLTCINNQLVALNLQGLMALQILFCKNNQLTALKLQGPMALQDLWCENNQLTTLNLQGLVALQTLSCDNNQLTALNLQGLTALQDLYCTNNRLTALNLKGLLALQGLEYNNNPLADLNLTGTPTVIKNQHAGLERRLLFNQLSQASSIQAKQAIITRLGADYTRENCLYYLPVDMAKLFITDAANQIYNLALSAFSAAYLPSFGLSNNAPNAQQEKPRDEAQMQDDNQMEQEEKEPGDEHNAKHRKTS